MAAKHSIWYHLGHALERARHTPPERDRVTGLVRRKAELERTREERLARPALPSSDELLATGIAVVVERVLAGWSGRGSPGFTRLVRAGAAGAAAALLIDLVRPLITGSRDRHVVDEGTADRLLAGAGQGLLYGSIVEPRLPGPAILKGAAFGSVEYLADPAGGLSGLLGSHAHPGPLRVLEHLREGVAAEQRTYLEHVMFGVALAALYGSGPRRAEYEVIDEE
jgi:hypothetical protein